MRSVPTRGTTGGWDGCEGYACRFLARPARTTMALDHHSRYAPLKGNAARMSTKTKQRQKRNGKRTPPAAKRPRAPRQSRSAEPPPSLQQGLLELASDSAQSFLWVSLALAVIVAIAGAAFGIWSLRPTPSYSSRRVEAGSPFDVTFQVENTSAWFSLSNLRIVCVLAHGGVPERPSIEADDVRFPGKASDLDPGQSATFKCPFHALLGNSNDDDLDLALRSEIYFRSEYDLSMIGSLRISANEGPFSLNRKLLPPRWTAGPNE